MTEQFSDTQNVTNRLIETATSQPRKCSSLQILDSFHEDVTTKPLAQEHGHFPHYRAVSTQATEQDSPFMDEIIGDFIQLSFRSSIGAGGNSLGGSLSLRRIRRPDSPVFLLFETFEWKTLDTVPEYITTLTEITREARVLFRQGSAVPTEVDDMGMNLLGVSDT